MNLFVLLFIFLKDYFKNNPPQFPIVEEDGMCHFDYFDYVYHQDS